MQISYGKNQKEISKMYKIMYIYIYIHTFMYIYIYIYIYIGESPSGLVASMLN